MHCNQQGGHAACYVSNYGPQPFPVGTLDNNTTYPNSAQALTELEAIASSGHAAGTPLPFAAVAMKSLPPAPAPATVAVNEWDGVTANLGPPKNCLANYSGNHPPSNHDVDTGLDIETGDIVHFSAAGSLWTGYCFIGNNTADGMSWTEDGHTDYPLPAAHEAALIGTVGHQGGPYFEIGRSFDYVHSGPPGRLFLRTNDNNPGNGSGSFSVSIEIFRQLVPIYIYDQHSNLLGVPRPSTARAPSHSHKCAWPVMAAPITNRHLVLAGIPSRRTGSTAPHSFRLISPVSCIAKNQD